MKKISIITNLSSKCCIFNESKTNPNNNPISIQKKIVISNDIFIESKDNGKK